MNNSQDQFGSKFGALAALAGSAIGLGNIWKFPYVTGENGGGAFLVIYIICILVIGIPIMMTEFAMGRRGGKNVYGTFKTLAPGTHWGIFSIITIVTAAAILSFYSTISGWTMEYVWLSVKDSFATMNDNDISVNFAEFTSHPYRPILWQVGFMVITALIIVAGVKKGIERYSKMLMPLLLVIVILMSIRSLTLNENSIKGIQFLFYPDFSNLSSKSVLLAMGQAFFSLSVGMGILMTYASYVQKSARLQRMAFDVAIADTLIAVLAGVAILPATFAFGMEPNAGPGLVFLTLPKVFMMMPWGQLWSILFFILLTVAALTSAISLLEVVVAFIVQETKITRIPATIICTVAITLMGVLSTLSFGPLRDTTFFGKTFFDIFDFISSNLLLPIGGMLICIFAAYVMDRGVLREELSNGNTLKVRLFGAYVFLLKYIAPIAIILIMFNSLGLVEYFEGWYNEFMEEPAVIDPTVFNEEILR